MEVILWIFKLCYLCCVTQGLENYNGEFNATLLNIFGTPTSSRDLHSNHLEDNSSPLHRATGLNKLIFDNFGPPAPLNGLVYIGRKRKKSHNGWKLRGRNKNNYGEPELLMSKMKIQSKEPYDSAINEEIRKMFPTKTLPPEPPVVIHYPGDANKHGTESDEDNDYGDESGIDIKFRSPDEIISKFSNFPRKQAQDSKEHQDSTTPSTAIPKIRDTLPFSLNIPIPPILNTEIEKNETNDAIKPAVLLNALFIPSTNAVNSSEINPDPYNSKKQFYNISRNQLQVTTEISKVLSINKNVTDTMQSIDSTTVGSSNRLSVNSKFVILFMFVAQFGILEIF